MFKPCRSVLQFNFAPVGLVIMPFITWFVNRWTLPTTASAQVNKLFSYYLLLHPDTADYCFCPSKQIVLLPFVTSGHNIRLVNRWALPTTASAQVNKLFFFVTSGQVLGLQKNYLRPRNATSCPVIPLL